MSKSRMNVERDDVIFRHKFPFKNFPSVELCDNNDDMNNHYEPTKPIVNRVALNADCFNNKNAFIQ